MDMQQFAPVTQNFTKLVLAAGTTNTLSTTNGGTFAINGILYFTNAGTTSGTAFTNQALPTTDFLTGNAFIPIPVPLSSPNLAGVPNGAVGYGCVYTIGLDHTTNAIRCIQGQIAAMDVNGKFITAPQFGGLGGGSGTLDNDFCAIGYVFVYLGSTATATWTFGRHFEILFVASSQFG